MRPPRRKAAVETQRRVTALLVNHAEIDGVPSDAEVIVASDHEFDKELTMEAVMPNRGGRKKRNAKYVYEQSHVITETTVNQNNMFESDIGDSDFEAEMQTSDDRDADLSSGEEIIVSSDKETKNKRKGSKPVKNARRSKKLRKQKEKKPLHVEDGVADDLNWQVWEKGLEDWEPWAGNGELDLDAFAQKKGPMEEQEPPPEMLMPLLPFQKEWLAWSLKQEESEFKGGILADEMGMGKTIQAISLFLCSRDLRLKAPLIANSSKLSNIEVGSTSKSKVLPQIKTTLVVCPMVAVIQWRNEIARFTSEGSTKVLIYHGANRCKDIAELSDYDIVLTTYNIIESEHRKKMMPGKERCQWCCKLFYPERLGIHQRYFCGPFAVKSEKQSKQVKKNGKQAVYGKTSKKKTIDEERNDKDVDVSKGKMKGKGKSKVSKIIKSAMDGNKNKNADLDDSEESGNKLPGSSNDMGPSVLHSVKWDRIILDEAHFIKDRTCSTAKAVFSLESSYKWALSGTPLQNRVGELYSLVRFLQIYPYSYYHCKKCNCKSLDYRFGKDGQKCDDCGHSAPQHFCWWNKFVANPIKKWGYTNYGHKALILLKYKILNSIVLRRTKIERAADLALPPRIAFLRRDAFDAREQDFYEALYTQSQSQFNTYITAGTLLNNYAHIFDLLTRLRQAVDHPYLVVYSKTAQSNPNNQNGAYDLSSGKSDCGLCHEVSDDMVSATCGHTFCKGCIEEYISTTGQSSCPSCLEPLTIDLTGRKSTNKVKGYKSSSILNRINLDDFQTSTKIDALREEIMLMLQKDAAAKAIVFSQFTSFLDLIKFCLQKSGTKCVQLDGSMSIQARDQTIEKFTNDPDCKIFLMSLKAGGVALNLTVASHVFLMDPWWNPAVEQQAQDRIHRLGQYKPIRVVRFVIANTIEERILKLQEKKQLVFEGTVGGSSEALGKLTEDDLRFLFKN